MKITCMMKFFLLDRLFFVLFIALIVLFSSFSSYAQTSDEARLKANAALAQGDFETAIEFLQLLIEYHKDTNQKLLIRSMESIYYNLGIAFFFTARFEDAEKAFEFYNKKYPTGSFVSEAYLYIADALRFRGKIDAALKAYDEALKKFKLKYSDDLKTDILCAMVRCKIAQDKWTDTVPFLREIVEIATDSERRNWAFTIWTIVYLKNRDVENVFKLVPILLEQDSFASQSVALNMAALETADDLFSEEMYREALWVYRLVYSHDALSLNASRALAKLQRNSELLKKRPDALRPLMRLQERIGEIEAEIKVLDAMANYDIELYSRMARAYMEVDRYREARELFLYLHGETEGAVADENLYFAFRCSLNLRPLDSAFAIGKNYMEKYPNGEYFDSLTIAIGQVYAMLQDWPMVIEHLKKTLAINPKHQDSAECEFLIAYASFMEEDFEQTIYWLSKMNREHPENPRLVDALYWLGMARMFTKDYKGSAYDFDDLLTRFSGSVYTEDAKYRRAVCDFGLSKMEETEKRLNEFVMAYPKSKLTGEAYMMLGDVAAFFGQPEKAVTLYQEVANHEINIELYNYSMFKCGEILFQEEMKYDKKENKNVVDYDAVISHFNRYVAKNREGSNIPQAIFYIGRSYWSKGEKMGALERYMDAIRQYGNDVNALGIDMILEEWIGKVKGIENQELKERAWGEMSDSIKKAEDSGARILALRLKRALLYKDNPDEKDVIRIKQEIVQEKNLPIAGPSTLEFIMDEALKQNNFDLANKTANTIVEVFTETDYALSARMFLSREALKNKDYKTALAHLGVIREVFASDLQAAEALAMIGDIYLEQKKYAEADEAYKAILAVKEWKGKLWPRALYGRGESAIGAGKPSEACVYYERIYVMYSFYKDWASKAYLKRGQCLANLREYNKAVDTLREMLKHEELSSLPEWKEAQQEIEKYEKRI